MAFAIFQNFWINGNGFRIFISRIISRFSISRRIIFRFSSRIGISRVSTESLDYFSTILHSGTYAQRKCWLRDVNHLKSEVADHQVSGLGFYKEQRSAIETRISLMSVENFFLNIL